MSSLDRITQKTLVDWLGAHEVAKGLGYLSRVSRLSSNEFSVTAHVKGTKRTPYSVYVEVAEGRDGMSHLISDCTCPVGSDCKHVAAMMLAWLRQRGSPDRPREEVRVWIEALRSAVAADGRAEVRHAPDRRTHGLVYLLGDVPEIQQHAVRCYKARFDKQGRLRHTEHWFNFERALETPPAFVDDRDLEILRLLWAQRPRQHGLLLHALPLDGRHAGELMPLLAESGRAYYDDFSRPPLHAGSPRPGRPDWLTTPDGRRAPTVRSDPAADVVLPLLQPWYVDTAHSETGPVTLDVAPDLVHRLLRLPPLTAVEAEMVAQAMAELTPALPSPTQDAEPAVQLEGPPVPVLQLATIPVIDAQYRGYAPYGTWEFDFATLAFRYGPLTIAADDPALFHCLPDGRSARIARDGRAEHAAQARLGRAGFAPVPAGKIQSAYKRLPDGALGLASEDDWPAFMAGVLPGLRAEGWHIDTPGDFRHHATDVDALVLDVDATDGDWLAISPGIEVEGRPVALGPLLAGLFAEDGRWLSGRLDDIADREAVILHHEELGRLRLSAGRLKPLVRALVDLFDRPDGRFQVSRLDAARLADLDLPGRGREFVAELAGRLCGAAGIEPVPAPAGFHAELRPYQLEGLAWLQHLTRHDLAGILADDMGLGKTAQALAHLLTLKRAGRLDVPALVILPTSLVFNWQAEAARFAPGLKVLSLHGTDRHARFAELEVDGAPVDVALTTYPLLWRDAEALQAREWSLLILDEAQTVKNAASKGAQVIRQLRARHRLGLTGTPLENHLGELWAQFDFLLPGFLGSQKQFNATWRTPIEKHGDTLRRDLLAARLRPFILRRRKEDVAAELPPKTVIVRSVGLEGGQRDLYETVRAAMDERVRHEIADKGFARSQIVILDALLKLRQVCCDPRLLKSPAAAKVKERAKLGLLMDMLPELIAEGRRILIFSQFTTMLALIAAELDRAKIGWVSLTGDTRDRRIPVEDFQKGRAPVFLISLKAGGVGLNLTTADTVIHYDPWWNPAAENQATDRAHRIGQDKPVFVFKLICAGSIEERILALQERKAALAAGVLSEDADALAKFGAADIAALLAPLPSTVPR
ncbi:DEAD/DEAH box helicase [Thauera sinica]|nr:DEAD/DEAH box helicase [Thauera sp. K11]ATE58839.1 helicase SNF [Thauera sp. K11]